MSTANQVYQGLANVGKAKATVGVVIAALVASSLCTSGAMTMNNAIHEKHTEQIQATVSNVKCTNNVCTITATYQVNGNSYSINTTVGAPAPDKITLYYDPKNPADSETFRTSKSLAYVLMMGGLCVIVIGIIIYSLTNRFKVVAAVEGADTLFNFAKHL